MKYENNMCAYLPFCACLLFLIFFGVEHTVYYYNQFWVFLMENSPPNSTAGMQMFRGAFTSIIIRKAPLSCEAGAHRRLGRRQDYQHGFKHYRCTIKRFLSTPPARALHVEAAAAFSHTDISPFCSML